MGSMNRSLIWDYSPPTNNSGKKQKPDFQTGFAIRSPPPCLCCHRKATKCRCWVNAFWVWFTTWRYGDCNVTNSEEYSPIQNDVNGNTFSILKTK